MPQRELRRSVLRIYFSIIAIITLMKQYFNVCNFYLITCCFFCWACTGNLSLLMTKTTVFYAYLPAYLPRQ